MLCSHLKAIDILKINSRITPSLQKASTEKPVVQLKLITLWRALMIVLMIAFQRLTIVSPASTDTHVMKKNKTQSKL